MTDEKPDLGDSMVKFGTALTSIGCLIPVVLVGLFVVYAMIRSAFR